MADNVVILGILIWLHIELRLCLCALAKKPMPKSSEYVDFERVGKSIVMFWFSVQQDTAVMVFILEDIVDLGWASIFMF